VGGPAYSLLSPYMLSPHTSAARSRYRYPRYPPY